MIVSSWAVFCILALLPPTYAACSVKTPNGLVDLSSLTSSIDYTFAGTSASFKFLLNVCAPIKFVDGACIPGTGLCQTYSTTDGLVGYGPSTNNVQYDPLTGNVFLSFSSGTDYCISSTKTPYTAKVLFTCDPNGNIGNPTLLEESNCDAQVKWVTSAACPTSGPAPINSVSALSPGGWAMVLFALVVITYIFCGVSYRYQFTESRGFDLVPNREFWRELPSLIKDGFMFAIRCGRV